MNSSKRILEIHRKGQLANAIRKIGIYINGKKVDTIGDGEIKQFEIDGEDCEVYVKIDWCKTKPLKISADEGDLVRLELGCILSGWLHFSLCIATVLLYIIFQSSWFFFLLCLPSLWYTFVQPSKYLYLKRQEESE